LNLHKQKKIPPSQKSHFFIEKVTKFVFKKVTKVTGLATCQSKNQKNQKFKNFKNPEI
jgi:hypothetical protein